MRNLKLHDKTVAVLLSLAEAKKLDKHLRGTIITPAALERLRQMVKIAIEEVEPVEGQGPGKE